MRRIGSEKIVKSRLTPFPPFGRDDCSLDGVWEDCADVCSLSGEAFEKTDPGPIEGCDNYGGGGGGGGGSPPPKRWNPFPPAIAAMPSAIKAAAAALQNNADCMNLFGTAQTRANGFDPVAALTSVYSGVGAFNGSAGLLGGEAVESDFDYGWMVGGDAATHQTIGVGVVQGSFYAGLIQDVSINVHEWNSDSTNIQASILLHELGHVYANLAGYGSGGSAILNDSGNPTQSAANTAMILKACNLTF